MATSLRRNDSSEAPSQCIAPEKRHSHEFAVVDDQVHLFGGRNSNRSCNFPRNEIWMMNIRRAEKKWIRRLTRGQTIPPPCAGARSVVIDKMIYSYGGMTDNGRFLGIVYRLDPKKMEWIEMATPTAGKKPHERSECCLCAIGSRMIMFGGRSGRETSDQLQSGATREGFYNWSNDIYEFKLEEENEKGMWLDLELTGRRPKPLACAAMAAIDQHRALLHGRDMKLESQAFVINLNNKTWTIINFDVNPSPRRGHAICQLVKERLEDKFIFILIGGRMIDERKSDYVYVLDCENSKAYQMEVNPQLGRIWMHTCYCVRNEDKSTDVVACGGWDWDGTLRPIVNSFRFDFKSESYMRIEREILSSRRALVDASLGPRPSPRTSLAGRAAVSPSRCSLSNGREEVEMMQRELEHLRRRCAEIADEKRLNVTRFEEQMRIAQRHFREELASSQHLVQRKDGEIAQIREQLESVQREASVAQRRLEQRKDEQIASIREQLASVQREASAAQRHRHELAVALTRCQTLEESRDEMQGRLDEYINVFNVNSDEVDVTDQKLGSGAFAGAFVGQWRGMTIAVKRIHDLIANQHNIEMFKQEVLVCSRLHHPNIMTVCGAVMAEGVPFQMIMELLEGSVSEVITAAHASGSYLTISEQLSIAKDMTSGIAYLHQIRPRPYVHGDIRPSNILVTRDMTVKVGDLGAAHLIESSLSAGPLSPPYLAPERAPRPDGTAASSTLSGDVYSVGVSLIEIFTGAGPIPEVRQTQLDALANRPNLFMLCSQLIGRDPANRMSAQVCFETLKFEFTENESRMSALGIFVAKRMVKGVFGLDTHKVIFPSAFY